MAERFLTIVKLASRDADELGYKRDEKFIYDHMIDEVDELRDELKLHAEGNPPGPDGIVGESIDVIACALDLIFKHAPDITYEQLCVLMQKKCDKWLNKIQNSY